MPITKETLDFLLENRLHDSRAWFEAHRADYERLVKRPMQDLCVALAPAAVAIDPLLITEPKIGKCISRIFRDTRFSRDKSIFRDHMWCVFAREKKEHGSTMGLYFEISPAGFSYGCGYYQTPPPVVRAIRALILAGDRAFLDAQAAMRAAPQFALEGERYKRTRYPDQPEALREWLDRRSLSFNCDSADYPLLFSDRITQAVADGFAQLAPVYRFFRRAEDVARLEEASDPLR